MTLDALAPFRAPPIRPAADPQPLPYLDSEKNRARGAFDVALTLSNGERRTFLEDGDGVVLSAWCERPGQRRIGFGECRGTVAPARRTA